MVSPLAACTFQTLDEAVAAFSLGPLRFRCSVCGRVHASDLSGWEECLAAFVYWNRTVLGKDETLPEIPASAPEKNQYWAFFSKALSPTYLIRYQVPFHLEWFCRRHAPALLAVPGVERFLAEKFAEEKRGHVAKALPLMEDLIGARRDALRVVEENAALRFERNGKNLAAVITLPKGVAETLRQTEEAVYSPVRVSWYGLWVLDLARSAGLPDGEERYELEALSWDKSQGAITAVLVVRLYGLIMGRCVVRCSRDGPAAVVSVIPRGREVSIA